MDALLTVALFLLACASIAAACRRWIAPVPKPVILLFVAIVAAYQSPTLFSNRVDLPMRLSYHAFPWRALRADAANANTGIVFTQLAPWTDVARNSLRAGELPVWNRFSAAGAPLLANQQTAIFHPLTLLGLPLTLGKAFTLSASVRLFVVLLFMFTLLRQWDVSPRSAVFGAVAYAFSTFHVVWLLFPLGLVNMMMPLCLTAADLLVRTPQRRHYVLLVIALCLAVLGGHPESALYVWLTTAIYAAAVASGGRIERVRSIAVAASTFLIAMSVTAFWWYPTLRALQETARFQVVQSAAANPADHGLSVAWLLPLLHPNVLGTPMRGDYSPPPSHATVLSDYGEVASGYAGIVTIGLAVIGLATARGRGPATFALLAAAAFLTFAEAPLWRDAVRIIPLLGISIHQRLRIVFLLGLCALAAFGLDRLVHRRRAAAVQVSCAIAVMALYLWSRPAALMAPDVLAAITGAVVAAVVIVSGVRHTPAVLTIIVLTDVLFATHGYNPPSHSSEVFPETPAIAALRPPIGQRVAALGSSLLPDTPGAYGLEDIKTTDPVSHGRYLRLLRGYLDIPADSYDLLIGTTARPFFDYLGVQRIYAPPGARVEDPALRKVYSGPDGDVYANPDALPRYFFVSEARVIPTFDAAVWHSREIDDFRTAAIVDEVPDYVRRRAPGLGAASAFTQAGGTVTMVAYGHSGTTLNVDSHGWNLLVTSEVAWAGWRAFWNGKPLPTVTVNGAFVGVFVPPGTGTVLLRYRPPGFELCLIIAAFGTLVLGSVMLIRSSTVAALARRLLVIAA